MTEEQLTAIQQFLQPYLQQIADHEKRIGELERVNRDLQGDNNHLQGQVITLQRSNSALHQWQLDHDVEHDTERLRLKQRIATLEKMLRENNIPIPV